MDFDFDDQPSDNAAPAARAGAKFKPKGRPQTKKKQVSLSTSLTTLSNHVAKDKLSTQSQDQVSLHASSAYPCDVSTSDTIVPYSGPINKSIIGTVSKENVFSEGVSVLRACSSINSEGKRCNNGREAVPAYPDDPRRQDSATFGDFATPEMNEVTYAQTQRMQMGEEGCHWNMETLNIVQDEGITTAYEQHTGKFQPKPRLHDTVIEEPVSHYSVDYTPGASQSELMVIVESRNEFNTNNTFYTEIQEEEHNIPEAPIEMVPGVVEHEHHVVSPSTNNTAIGEEGNGLGNTVEEETRSGRKRKKGKAKRARKRKTTNEEEPNKSSETPQKNKKFKHSSRRQRNRTLEKELLETPDDEIRYLPIKDMLRLVEYREWLEKKEAKGAPVVPPAQESNTNASEDNQYYSQGFDAEDEFGMEDSENQETDVVKPDSPVNYQTYMNKTPRTRWSKQDTELFYEGLQEFGSNLSMVQQLFPDRTRQQIKLKFKSEERKYPLKLNDALSTRSKHLTHFHTVIKKLQQEAAAEKEGEEEEEEAGEEAETTTDVPENEEPAKSEETELVGEDIENGLRWDGGDECDDTEEDDEFWNSYKSDM